ncbi:type I-C CRISPR-associated protein Cas7/Csd2 [Acidaminococcus massiliensis]|uniref:type I-C CRISPR-associated protein Cas7/Csd2 n=1 Tax=Acidaminococcus massiliensis TaxID=1852375 RepID=UPI0026DC9542|nr:type I-C CRISPR-associated protein Cas7/Csd2 [Acidaminococcus massiliensis]
MEENKAIRNRYDFVVLFDVENGNPNGDPDAGNMPRVDPETGLGLVTDVCLKRKIRNYVEAAKEDQPGYQIYVRETVPLEANDKKALEYLGVDDVKKIDKKKDPDADRKIRDFMCSNFYDIRTFGAVMTTFVKGALSCGQVRGPVQLGFAHSIDPIMPQEITITRVAITTAKRQEEGRNTEMGRKYIVPYGLYRVEGYVSANLARKSTGFSDEDLQLLWKAIINMFENDHSAARGNMAVRELIVFKHESELGNAPSYKLFERVQVAKKDPRKAPRAYHDYQVTVDTENLPEGVTCQRMV